MRNLFYITRTYLPDRTGGTQARAQAVKLFKEHFDVIVVTAQQSEGKDSEGGVDRIKAPGNLRLLNYKERIGLVKDYMAPWAEAVAECYKSKINSDDIVFCTSGGEMGSLYAGFLLKKETGCKYVINLRDPSVYTKVNGLKIDHKFHVPREKFERELIESADLVITSSEMNRKSLSQKYPEFSVKIINNYFGYICEPSKCETKKDSLKPRFVYGGRFGQLQRPELFAKGFGDIKDAELVFIGNYKNYKPIWKYTDRYEFIEHMPSSEYHDYMSNHADVGLLSLSSDYLGACVPAKMFDYISMGIPMLGLLPYGDAFQIIQEHKYGRVKHYSEYSSIVREIEFFCDKGNRNAVKDNVLREQSGWAMKLRIEEIIPLLNSI